MARIEELESIARKKIGDGKTPNFYVVTDNGDVVTITTDGPTAYRHFRKLTSRYPLVECALESRDIGCIASVEPRDDNDPTLVYCDDSYLDLRLLED